MTNTQKIEIINQLLKKLELDYAFILSKPDEMDADYRDIDIFVRQCDMAYIATSLVNEVDKKGYRLFNVVKNSYSFQLYWVSQDHKDLMQVDLMPKMSFRGIPYMMFDDLDKDSIETFNGIPFVNSKEMLAYNIIRSYLQIGCLSEKIKKKWDCLDDINRKKLAQAIDLRLRINLSKFIFNKGQNQINLRKMRLIFLTKALVYRPVMSLTGLIKHVYYTIHRSINYPGLMLVVLGPDGAGKTSVINELIKSKYFKEIGRYYLLPGWLKRYTQGSKQEGAIVTDPHGRKARSPIFSILKQFIWIYEYVGGYFGILLHRLRLGDLIIFDRYFSDMVIDTKRYRYGGPMWFIRLVDKLIPQPDITILLYAPADVIQRRKQEVPFEETERQLYQYTKYVASLKSHKIIDAQEPVPQVVNSIEDTIIKFLINRAEIRFKSIRN